MVTLEQRAHGHPGGPWGHPKLFRLKGAPAKAVVAPSSWPHAQRSASGRKSGRHRGDGARMPITQERRALTVLPWPRLWQVHIGKRCLREQALLAFLDCIPSPFPGGQIVCHCTFPALSQNFPDGQISEAERISFLVRTDDRTGTAVREDTPGEPPGHTAGHHTTGSETPGGAWTHRTDTLPVPQYRTVLTPVLNRVPGAGKKTPGTGTGTGKKTPTGKTGTCAPQNCC
jgi:hypothetical protein